MTDIWFFDYRKYPEELVQAQVELCDDFEGWGDISPYRTRTYSFNYNGYYYPHYTWGEDMWHTREEAVEHRCTELYRQFQQAKERLDQFKEREAV